MKFEPSVTNNLNFFLTPSLLTRDYDALYLTITKAHKSCVACVAVFTSARDQDFKDGYLEENHLLMCVDLSDPPGHATIWIAITTRQDA